MGTSQPKDSWIGVLVHRGTRYEAALHVQNLSRLGQWHSDRDPGSIGALIADLVGEGVGTSRDTCWSKGIAIQALIGRGTLMPFAMARVSATAKTVAVHRCIRGDGGLARDHLGQ